MLERASIAAVGQLAGPVDRPFVFQVICPNFVLLYKYFVMMGDTHMRAFWEQYVHKDMLGFLEGPQAQQRLSHTSGCKPDFILG